MKLSVLLSGLADIPVDPDVTDLALDSRDAQAGGAFVAVAGTERHGMEFAQQAVQRGVVTVVYDPVGMGSKLAFQMTGVLCVPVENLARKLGEIAARFFGYPSKALKIIGITGTNGKTSCSHFLAQALSDCAIIGTLGWGERGRLHETINTTPDALSLQKMFAQLVKQHKQAVAMEVSSHGLAQGRVNGVCFKGVMFTSISRDHLDYHGSMAAYVEAKLSLLAQPELEFAVINLDDTYIEQVKEAVPEKVMLWTYSATGKTLEPEKSVIASNIQYSAEGVECDVRCSGQQSRLTAPVFGEFNLENILAVLTTLLAMQLSFSQALKKISTIKPVTGRMERFYAGKQGPVVFVDYAHTPDALEKVLLSLKKHYQQQLWLVFGCGGNRDQGKRAQMGKIAEQLADRLIVTDDNPRNENPEKIIADIVSGCKARVEVIHDRRKAIQRVIAQASAECLVLIAGKGHENYQEVNGERKPFDDRQIVGQSLLQRSASLC